MNLKPLETLLRVWQTLAGFRNVFKIPIFTINTGIFLNIFTFENWMFRLASLVTQERKCLCPLIDEEPCILPMIKKIMRRTDFANLDKDRRLVLSPLRR